MNKNQTEDYLAEIYRGSRMGSETIDTLLPKVNDSKMRSELVREKQTFSQFEEKALKEITDRGEKPHEIGKMQEMAAWMGIQMNTASDNTPSHIADLMIQGNNMGVIGMTKTINDHAGEDNKIESLAEELVQIQEDNIGRLKQFL